jgi:hypothetical protein
MTVSAYTSALITHEVFLKSCLLQTNIALKWWCTSIYRLNETEMIFFAVWNVTKAFLKHV